MTNGNTALKKSIRVSKGATARTRFPVANAHVCQSPGAITFPTHRSFLEPTSDNKSALRDLIARLHLPGTHDRLLINGHTDSVGDAGPNEELSERRTRSAQGLLQRDAAAWERLFGEESWGDPELTAMVLETGDADTASAPTVIARFRGASNGAARADLFRRYFDRLLGTAPLPAIRTTSPALLGCGENQLLHGDRANPSRDVTLPAIQGEFRPNRRVEFYFFDATSTPITCAAYPTWTAPCSLIPPASSITVTIEPVSALPKNRATDVRVTVSPSPLPFRSTITLTLATTTGSGEARFTSSNSATTTIRDSAVVSVKGVSESSVPNNIRLSATVTSQTTVLAQQDMTVEAAVRIHLQFEVWNAGRQAFEPLPAGVAVDVVDFDPISSNDVLSTGTTDAAGRVFFNVDALTDPDEAEPDIFFLVHTNGRTHAGHTLPQQWSTKGWKASDGTTPGFVEDYTGAPIGSASTPVVFRVGVDFHAAFLYRNARTGSDDPAPPQIPVDVHSSALPIVEASKLQALTDVNGEVHGVVFDIAPGDDFFFRVRFEMTDPAINLPRARVQLQGGDQSGWSTFFSDADRKVFADHDRTSIGTQAAPERFLITVSNRDFALYFLKILREWSIFLFRITGGAWTGVENLEFIPVSVSGVAFSFPIGTLNIPRPDHFSRGTLTHELSHQIMWKEVNFSSLAIAYQGTFGNLRLFHRSDLLANTVHALIEGWAEFMESVFEGTSTPPFAVSTVSDTDGVSKPLGPPPNDRGESVEGAFADGLWALFEKHVVTPAVAASAHVPESRNGDVMATSAGGYLNATAVRDRFLSMVWNPLKDLRPLSSPTATDMLQNIRTRNLAVWHTLQPELQTFNMAMTVPTATAIAPIGGPPAGGIVATITGTNFTLGTTQVAIGGTRVAGTVTDTTSLTVTIPSGSLGRIEVVVTTPAGSSAPVPGGFTYANAPVVSGVTLDGAPPGTPPRGPTTGGTVLRIAGSGFDSGATVTIGGVPATGVSVISPTEIRATTPVRRLPLQPGGVPVAVKNPDGQTGSLDPGFEYLAVPPPRLFIINPPSGASAGGETIELQGDGFLPGVTVTIAGRRAEIDAANTSETRITAVTPARPAPIPPGNVEVRVENVDGNSALGDFTYTP